MKNLVTFGAPHQGIYGLQKCKGEIIGITESGQFLKNIFFPGKYHTFCDYARRLLNYGPYITWIQKTLVPAQYWHDPTDEEEYK